MEPFFTIHIRVGLIYVTCFIPLPFPLVLFGVRKEKVSKGYSYGAIIYYIRVELRYVICFIPLPFPLVVFGVWKEKILAGCFYGAVLHYHR